MRLILTNWGYLFIALFSTFVLLNGITGLAIFFVLLSSLILVSKKNSNKELYFWFICSIFFSGCLVVFANILLTFFNIILICYSLSGMIFSGHKISLAQFLFAPVINFYLLLSTKGGILPLFPRLQKQQQQEDKLEKPKDLEGIILTSFVTFIIVILLIVLLASANPLFANFFNTILGFFNLDSIFRVIFSIFRFEFYIGILLAIILKKLTLYIKKIDLKKEIYEKSYQSYEQSLSNLNKKISFVIPKISAFSIVLIFFVTQIQLYLANTGVLLSLGLSRQDKVNEIFFQLLMVSLIVITLVFFNTQKNKLSNIFGSLLLVEAIFLTINALASNLDYILTSGIGPKRLYGLAVIIFVTILIGFIFLNIQKRNDSTFFKRTLALICTIFIFINLINFDKTMVEVNNKMGKVSEVQNLSTDSGAWDEEYFQLSKLEKPLNPSDQTKYDKLTLNIWGLQQEQKSVTWQNFNLSRYNQYQQIKDLDVN
jgi:hypothetical protein